MVHPLFNQEGELVASIQVISREKKNAKGKQKLYAGFTNFDEQFFHIVAAFVQAKVGSILANFERKRIQKEVVQTISAASIICTQRSYSDFIMNCREILPRYFGFEGIGILFRD